MTPFARDTEEFIAEIKNELSEYKKKLSQLAKERKETELGPPRAIPESEYLYLAAVDRHFNSGFPQLAKKFGLPQRDCTSEAERESSALSRDDLALLVIRMAAYYGEPGFSEVPPPPKLYNGTDGGTEVEGLSAYGKRLKSGEYLGPRDAGRPSNAHRDACIAVAVEGRIQSTGETARVAATHIAPRFGLKPKAVAEIYSRRNRALRELMVSDGCIAVVVGDALHNQHLIYYYMTYPGISEGEKEWLRRSTAEI